MVPGNILLPAGQYGSGVDLGRYRLGYRQREDFVGGAVYEFDRDLDAGQPVFARKIGGALRMLKIMRLVGIHGPASQAAQVKLRARVLQ